MNVKIPNSRLQKMFVENLQRKIRDKLMMMKFPTFMHLCTALRDYQNSVTNSELKTTPTHPKIFEASNQNTYSPFRRKNKSFLQLNSTSQPTQPIDTQVAAIKKSNPYIFGDIQR